jgi:prevent-host-death family protein
MRKKVQGMLKTHERIVAAQDLAKQVETVLANAQQEPVIITEHGRPAAYLISVELFDRLMAELEAIDSSELATNITAADKQFNEGAFKMLEEAEAIVEAFWNQSEADE